MRTLPSIDRYTLPVFAPSNGISQFSDIIARDLGSIQEDILRSLSSFSVNPNIQPIPMSEPIEALHISLARLKNMTSYVAMHLGREWRDKLFIQLDELLSPDDWDQEEKLPDTNSFQTFLRLILYYRPHCRPAIGLFSGRFIGSWVNQKDMLTIECMPNDEVRWHMTYSLDGKPYVSSGTATISVLANIRSPYAFENWFSQ